MKLPTVNLQLFPLFPPLHSKFFAQLLKGSSSILCDVQELQLLQLGIAYAGGLFSGPAAAWHVGMALFSLHDRMPRLHWRDDAAKFRTFLKYGGTLV